MPLPAFVSVPGESEESRAAILALLSTNSPNTAFLVRVLTPSPARLRQ